MEPHPWEIAILEEAVRLHRVRDDIISSHDDSEVLRYLLLSINGEMVGIRKALCVINGWDIQNDCDHEGKAYDRVIEWWQETFPEEWSD